VNWNGKLELSAALRLQVSLKQRRDAERLYATGGTFCMGAALQRKKNRARDSDNLVQDLSIESIIFVANHTMLRQRRRSLEIELPLPRKTIFAYKRTLEHSSNVSVTKCAQRTLKAPERLNLAKTFQTRKPDAVLQAGLENTKRTI